MRKKIILLAPLGILVLGLILFGSSGTLRFWQAWVFMAVLFVPFAFVVTYLVRRSPKLVEKRMQFTEKQAAQKWLIRISQLIFLAGLVMAGLDFRYGWSQVPIWGVIVADGVIFMSCLFIFWVFKTNPFASRIVEVTEEQKVVSTGPYAVIRHPMYAAVIPMYLAIPLALGSFIALAFFAPTVLVVLYRIFEEEILLTQNLKGYKEYCAKVKYRLVPKIW